MITAKERVQRKRDIRDKAREFRATLRCDSHEEGYQKEYSINKSGIGDIDRKDGEDDE